MSHDEEVPAIVKNLSNVALNVAIAVVFYGQQIA
jgi:hypothetical protein